LRIHKQLTESRPKYQIKFLTEDVIKNIQNEIEADYGEPHLESYLHASLTLHKAAGEDPRIYYLNTRRGDDKMLRLEKTTVRDKRIKIFDVLWDAADAHWPTINELTVHIKEPRNDDS